MKMSKHFIILLIGLGVVTSSAYALDEVLTDTGVKKVIRVEKSGGDFSSPSAAVNSINFTSENQQYMIVVGPGEFFIGESLKLKPYVDIAGSGPDTTTLIMGIRGSTSSGIDIDERSGIGILENKKGFNTISNIAIENVSRTTQSNTGVFVEVGREAVLKNVRVLATGSSNNNWAVNVGGGRVTVVDSSIVSEAFGDSSNNVALYDGEMLGSIIEARRSIFSASGNDQSIGIDSIGLFGATSIHIGESRVNGTSYSIRLDVEATMVISDSFIAGEILALDNPFVTTGGSTFFCHDSYKRRRSEPLNTDCSN